MKEILLATNNKNKIREFKEIFKSLDVKLLTLEDLDIDLDVQETGITFEENSILKAKEIYKCVKMSVIAEDSGLVVDALDGRPGVFSKRYYGGKTGHEGNLMILDELKNISAEKRTARYIASLCYYDGENTIVAEGKCDGVIAYSESGTNGFVYDHIFIPNENNKEKKTFGELSSDFKNGISHRSRGIVNLLELLGQKNLI